MRRLPLIRPKPPRLSTMGDALRDIETRGIYSNGGPVVRAFEQAVTERLFGGRGASLAVSSATTGLMLALRYGTRGRGGQAAEGGLALVPSLTFAATAQAALWAGLTPLIHDIDPATWSSDPAAEEALIARYGSRVRAIVPYATFGRSLDLERYRWLARRHDLTVVIDAAASLGSIDADGLNFGAGAGFAVVYSMHATKTFATSEGGLIHSGDTALIDELRRMTNFGFGEARSADLPGMNAKLSEVSGLQAMAKLDEIDAVAAHRANLARAYAEALPEFAVQAADRGRQCYQFWSLLLPAGLAKSREQILAALAADGIGAGHYFSPHLAQQPLFQDTSLIEPTPVADDVGGRIVSLPITDAMTVEDVLHVAKRLRRAIARLGLRGSAVPAARTVHGTVIVGGGPAGTAMLTAAAKAGQLPDLVGAGLALIERGAALGAGELGGYAIRSDTTAETFLSAIKDNPVPELARLVDHPAGVEMARYCGQLGAPLTTAGELLAVTGQRLGTVVRDLGGTLYTRSHAVSARRTAEGLWATTVKPESGEPHEVLSRHVVIATGGAMHGDALRATPIAGSTLGDLAGDRLVGADRAMRLGGIEAIVAGLSEVRAPRIAIIGGSTSAMASAVKLLKCAGLPLGTGALTVLHRKPLRPFYPSREAALEDGFTDFTDADICPVSGFVYRLGGFRLESREMVLRALAIGGREPDPRLNLFQLGQHDDAEARAIIAEADVVIGATGYRPRALPVLDADGTPIALACHEGGPMVDKHCRVIAADGTPVAGAFGIGLGAGFVPWGKLGGEPSFRGNANGLWLWQNDVGQMIVDQVLGGSARAAAA